MPGSLVRGLLLSLGAAWLAGCSPQNRPPPVFVAASFADAATAACAASDQPRAQRLQVAASSVLAKQIVAGAAARCFISANTEWMDHLEQRGRLVPGSRRILVGNRLVVVVPSDGPAELDLATFDGHLVLGDPAHVPVGTYARRALQAAGLWSRLAQKVVIAADARAVLRLVERGEVDAGVVYETDARVAAVRVVRVLEAATVIYEVADVRRVSGDAEGQQFGGLAAELARPAALAIYETLGFTRLPAAVRANAPAIAASSARPPEAFAALRLSILIGFVATLLGILPAMGLAHWLARSRSIFRPIVESIVILPMVLPPVVVGYFLLVVLGRRGVLGSFLDEWFGFGLTFRWQGAAVAAMLMGFPLMVRTMRQAFENVDPGLEAAAATLGATRWTIFLRIAVPLAGRGMVAGAALCFARSLGEFGATITFAGNVPGETQTLPLAIWTALQRTGGEAAAWQLTWICVVLSVAATLLCEFLLRRPRPPSI